MTIKIIQITTKILDEERTVLSSEVSEGFELSPAEGKLLRNILTGEIIKGKVYVYQQSKIKNFIEIDEPKLD